jgi:hypothetical protein
MRPYLPVILASVLTAAGCTKDAEEHKKNLGEAAADASQDTKTLGEVEGAVNQVIRNASDCEVVKAALPEAQRKLDEAPNKLRTTAGRATLEALRTQVRTISQNCP